MDVIRSKVDSIHNAHLALIQPAVEAWFDTNHTAPYTNRDTDIADTITWYTDNYTDVYDYLVAGISSEANALEAALRSAVQAHIQARHLSEMGVSFGDKLITDFQSIFNTSRALVTYEGFGITSDMIDAVGAVYTGGTIETNTQPHQPEFDLLKPTDHILPSFIDSITTKVSVLGAYAFEQSAAINIGIEFGQLPSGLGDMPTLPIWYTSSKFQDLIDEFNISSLQPPTT